MAARKRAVHALPQVRLVRAGDLTEPLDGRDLGRLLHVLGDVRARLGTDALAAELRGLGELLLALGTSETPVDLAEACAFAERTLSGLAVLVEALGLDPARVAAGYRVEVVSGRTATPRRSSPRTRRPKR